MVIASQQIKQKHLTRSLLIPFLMTVLTIAVSFFLFTGGAEASADLNGIGGVTEYVPPETVNGSNADAVGDLFEELGVDNEATEKAKAITSPIAYWANIGFAILLSIAFIAMFFVTGLDLLYIAFPPVRKFLAPEQQAQGGGGMGMGMGGFGGGMGMGGMGGGQQSTGSKIGQWISDEALAAISESQPQQSGGGGMGMGMGGFGGGMGMGMGGGGEQAKPKMLIIAYFKKRVIFLILFAICALLLSTTLFTDIGISLGSWLMNRLLGINESIPS